MIELNIATATLKVDGRRADLPPREFAVLLTLALAPRVWPSYRLIPLLWPDSQINECSCLKVYVHRLRRRLGRHVIMSTNRGYELDRAVQVDLWRVEDLAKQPSLSPSEREALVQFAVAARGTAREYLSRWPWFAQVEGLVREAAAAVALRLEDDAAPAPIRTWRTLSGTSRRLHGQAAV